MSPAKCILNSFELLTWFSVVPTEGPSMSARCVVAKEICSRLSFWGRSVYVSSVYNSSLECYFCGVFFVITDNCGLIFVCRMCLICLPASYLYLRVRISLSCSKVSSSLGLKNTLSLYSFSSNISVTLSGRSCILLSFYKFLIWLSFLIMWYSIQMYLFSEDHNPFCNNYYNFAIWLRKLSFTSRKRAYIILTPLNPTFIY